MLNRRHLRIKVLQALYAFFQSKEDDALRTEKSVFDAIERIYDAYLYLLLTFGEVKSIAEHRIEENKKKLRPSDQDLNPNTKFIDNQIIEQLIGCEELRKISEDRKINWIGDDKQEIFRKMFLHIRESETYFEFMNNEANGFEGDRAFAVQLFKTEIANFPSLYHYFEEESIHWLDDIDLACSMAIKTLKTFEEGKKATILPLYKDVEDEKNFVKDLARQTILMDKENEGLIDFARKSVSYKWRH